MVPPASSQASGDAGDGSSASASPKWWESVSAARSRIALLSTILPSEPTLSSLADSDRPAFSLLHSHPVYLAAASALFGAADDPFCHWLYDTFNSPDPNLRLAALSFIPLVVSLYFSYLFESADSLGKPASSIAGLEAVLLAVYSSEVRARGGKPVVVRVPDLSLPSVYHTPASRQRVSPSSINVGRNAADVGVMSPTLEPLSAVKSTKRFAVVGTVFEVYFSRIAMMPLFSKVDLCDSIAAWAGQYCPCRFELDVGEEVDEASSTFSPKLSNASSSAEARQSGNDDVTGMVRTLSDEMRSISISDGGDSRNCSGTVNVQRKVMLPWELLQPLLRILGHCLLAPMNSKEVKDAAATAVRCVYARACHEIMPEAILASRSLIKLDKSSRKARDRVPGIRDDSAMSVGSKPGTPSKQKKPEVLLVSK